MEKQKLTNADFESIDPFEFKAPYFICMEHLARYVYAAYILKRKRVATVLDIACGCGYGSRELAREGIITTGFDYNPENIKNANEKYKIDGMTEYCCGDINNRDYLKSLNKKIFDAIVCYETLEHIKDPEGFLHDLYALLNKRGFMLLSVPDGAFEPVDNEGAIKSSYHLHAFSGDALCRLVESAGFKIIRKMYQPDVSGLHRNEYRAIRDTEETRESAEMYYNKNPDDVRFLSQIYAWPKKDKGQSYSIIYLLSK